MNLVYHLHRFQVSLTLYFHSDPLRNLRHFYKKTGLVNVGQFYSFVFKDFLVKIKLNETMNQKLQASHQLFKKWTHFSYSQVLRPTTVYHSNRRQVSSIVEKYSESDLSKNCRSILTNLLAGERWALARAITLIESTNKVNTSNSLSTIKL